MNSLSSTSHRKQGIYTKVLRTDKDTVLGTEDSTVTVKPEIPKNSVFVSTTQEVQINWFHTALLTITPLLSLYGLFTTPLQAKTIAFALFMYFWTGIGITGGYHRLWSHRAFSASFPIRLFLCLGGTGAFEGSIKWWCRNHRAHHRYTDTNKDPYNAKRGFWYAHLGWMLQKQNVKEIGFVDISDLQRDKLVEWQHRNYGILSILIGVLMPTFVAYHWGDLWGGFFFASMMRIVFVHHATFFVNSLAHTFGEKSFSDHHTAFDSFITAILTLGEGYHNYHHEFPQDYRNGIRFYHYDPTKWFIRVLSFLGFTYNLKEMSDAEILKSQLQMKQRKLDSEKASLQFGEKFNSLPEITWSQLQQRVKLGEQLIVIHSVVHNVASFVHEHPGGRQTLLNFIGTDATLQFQGKGGSLHMHSKEAEKYLIPMRVATLYPISSLEDH